MAARRPIAKSLWKLPEPWTHRTRPPLLGNHRTVSTATTGILIYTLTRGHFYRVKSGDISNES